MASHAYADYRYLYDIGRALDLGEADRLFHSLQDLECLRQLGCSDRKGHVGVLAVGREVLHNHVDIDIRFGQGTENAGRYARFIGHLHNRDLRLVLRIGDSADNLALHDLFLVTNYSADILPP